MPGDQFYIRAFWNLGSCRAIGMSLGPIPWTALVEYGTRAGLDDEAIEIFLEIMRHLDSAYLNYQEEEATKKRQATTRTNAKKTKGGGDSG